MKTCLRAGVCICRTKRSGELGGFLPSSHAWLLAVKVPGEGRAGGEDWGEPQLEEPASPPSKLSVAGKEQKQLTGEPEESDSGRYPHGAVTCFHHLPCTCLLGAGPLLLLLSRKLSPSWVFIWFVFPHLFPLLLRSGSSGWPLKDRILF